MEQPQAGDITGGTHAQRVVALAGALAEAGVTSLRVETPDGQVREVAARSADLPGLLADPRCGAMVYARSSTELFVEEEWIAWITADAALSEALRRAGRSLG